MEFLIYALLSVKNNSGKLKPLLAGIKGIFGESLFAVHFDTVAAIVGEIKKVDLTTDRTRAIEYAGVIESLTHQFTLLPMRYGSMMESTEAIVNMFERNHNEILQNLEKVEDKFEFGLKVFCDSEKIKAEVRAKSEASVKQSSNPELEIKHSVYLDYVNQKLKEHRLEELLMSYVDSVIAEIKLTLAQLNTFDKYRKMGTEKNIIDAVFLLEKDKKDEVLTMIEGLKDKYPGLNFILTGPWPPYSFVDITLI